MCMILAKIHPAQWVTLHNIYRATFLQGDVLFMYRECMYIIIGASLSEPHTSGTALRMCVCIFACLLACLRPYTVNF